MMNKPLEMSKGVDPDNVQEILGGHEPVFGTIFENAAIGLALISMNGHWVKINRCFSGIIGYSLEDLHGLKWDAVLLPQDVQHQHTVMSNLLQGHLSSFQIDRKLKHKYGGLVSVEYTLSIVRTSKGEPMYYVAQIRDITSRSEIEHKLAQSEQRYRSLIEHNVAGILTCDLSGAIRSVNPAMERIMGYLELEMIGQPISRFFGGREKKHIFSPGLIFQESDNYTLSVKHKNGETIELGVKNVPIIVNEAMEGMYLIARDITQHNKDRESLRLAQQDLHETVRRQQGMTMKFRYMRDRFIHTLCDGELLYRLGYKPSHIIGNGLYEIWPAYVAKNLEAYYKRAWEGEENVIYEATFRGITYLTSLRPIVESGKVVEVIGSSVDITERKVMETKLRETKELLESFINNTTDAICVLDPRARVLSVNKAYEHIFGWEQDELKGKVLPIYPDDLEEQRQEIYEMLKAGKQISGLETVRKRKDGQLVHVSVTKTPIKNEHGHIIGFAGITRDISERKRTEELLRKSDKLSVAGQLAAGLAHEIRNPLTSLRGFLQLLQSDMKSKQHYFDIMLSELDRINFIVSEFLVIAKPEAIQYKRGDLKEILLRVQALLDTQALLNNVELELELESELPEIICSEMHLKQLFINLVKNAIEAIPKEGRIRITASLLGTDRICIRTEDNGCGIPEARLKKLGEPFYTTKEKGTGLGLMMCFKIVEAHKGTMHVKSTIGEGTTIDVILPIHSERMLQHE
ncbi:PAS domain S-box protein [Paenibacillus hexagrammi]|uniref:histidine kinase n=1 Tax=Paenibacillus hexagrammi TaxID=2908839 RepID=A0ABY3SPK2_9BACL|nr:PAS domain S-box protein [Paenibacillus sp. YPD9-1]UJF35883.1 PAS domain S-box protein [Paenibacillus sp. YPD9-1]